MAVSQVANGRLAFPFDHEALLATIEAARASRVRDWVDEAAGRGIPVLCLRGELSKVWSREDFERERARFKGRANVEFREVAGAGHGLPFEKRAEFTAVLRERAGT
jgi:pimeloyl-ACP methyl ester carboxylesterase